MHRSQSSACLFKLQSAPLQCTATSASHAQHPYQQLHQVRSVSFSNRFLSTSKPLTRPPTAGNAEGAPTLTAHNGLQEGVALPKITPITGGPRPANLSKPTRMPVFSGISKEAYCHRSIFSLLRTLLVFRVCSIQYITRNSAMLLSRASKIFGDFFVYEVLVRYTVFAHFCGGSNEQEVRGVLKQLGSLGVGSVLDYAAEADVPDAPEHGPPELPSRSMKVLLKSNHLKYYPEDEEIYDTNMKLYMLCVSHASLNVSKRGIGIAAVKLTGLCDPRILSRLNAIILRVRQLWTIAAEKEQPLEQCRVIIGNEAEKEDRFVTTQQFIQAIPKMLEPETTGHSAPTFTEAQIAEMVACLDPDKDGKIDFQHFFYTIVEALNDRSAFPGLQPLIKPMPQLTEEEVFYFNELSRRVDAIVRVALELNARVLIDAEQTFYQGAIDHIVRWMQARYNKDVPVVYNTYQCYLTHTENRVKNDLKLAHQNGWKWGGKMVRGAYLQQEREVAEEFGYDSPVWPTLEETHACFERCTHLLLDTVAAKPDRPMGILFGSHNRQSIELACERMLKLPNNAADITFAQLLGMSDNLTMPLAAAGFPAFKYVPYGPIKETIHYLNRRAQENSAILKGGNTEIDGLRRELWSRIKFWK